MCCLSVGVCSLPFTKRVHRLVCAQQSHRGTAMAAGFTLHSKWNGTLRPGCLGKVVNSIIGLDGALAIMESDF